VNKKTIIIGILFITLLCLNLILLARLKSKDHQLASIMNKYKAMQKQSEIFTNSIKYQLENEIQNENIIFTSQILDTICIDSCLILRINTKGCQACISFVLNSLDSINNRLKKEIVIIGSFETKTEFKYYKEKLCRDYQIIDLGAEYLLSNELEENHIPYFFTIDRNRKIENLFIPDKNFPFLTDIYLKNILLCIKK